MNENGRDLLGSLDDETTAKDLAKAQSYSKAQFYRRAKNELTSTPMATRRRLLIERSAYELCHTSKSITEIAFDAQFATLEGFSRCFRRAFGVPPSRFREIRPGEWRLALGERLHYAPANTPHEQGDQSMDAIMRMLEHHCVSMSHYLDLCSQMSDDELNRETLDPAPMPWSTSRPTLGQILGRASAFAAPWIEAINGSRRESSPSTVPDMRLALDQSRKWSIELYRSISEDRTWDLTFVDSLCEPPEVFSYGGVIAHIVTNNAYRRYAILSELRARGHSNLRYDDPIEFGR